MRSLESETRKQEQVGSSRGWIESKFECWVHAVSFCKQLELWLSTDSGRFTHYYPELPLLTVSLLSAGVQQPEAAVGKRDIESEETGSRADTSYRLREDRGKLRRSGEPWLSENSVDYHSLLTDLSLCKTRKLPQKEQTVAREEALLRQLVVQRDNALTEYRQHQTSLKDMIQLFQTLSCEQDRKVKLAEP